MRNVARFSAKDIQTIVDILQDIDPEDLEFSEQAVVDEFVDALADCDSIEIVDDEDMLPSGN